MTTDTLEFPKIASRDVWLVARKKMLVMEKEATRARDALSAQRRALPWVRVEKKYVFDGPDGKETLADLFDTRSQLIVHHFMLGPGWGEGCIGCSFAADHIEGTLVHLEHHDVSLVRISRAPLPEIEAYRKRMGWRVKWVSSYNNDFNYDYHVSFTPEEIAQGKVYYNYEMRECDIDELSGVSVCYKDAKGNVFHTYSTYGRGDELADSTYMLLDMTPKGDLGRTLGLYRALHRHGPMTSRQFASKAGIAERYAREWLEQQAVDVGCGGGWSTIALARAYPG